MANLTIWHGGVKVFPLEEAPKSEAAIAEDKFETCKYRGTTQETRLIRTCCSSRELTGVPCLKLDAFPLTPERCKDCAYYENKGTVEVPQ